MRHKKNKENIYRIPITRMNMFSNEKEKKKKLMLLLNIGLGY